MNTRTFYTPQSTLGIVGFGAFGLLIAQNLQGYFDLKAYDPKAKDGDVAAELGVNFVSLETIAHCDIVVIAAPVSSFKDILATISAICRPGTLVIDVGSVKTEPAHLMEKHLPDYVDIIATHPLFGPQSACHGIKGLKIALCPVRGQQCRRLAAFLRKHLGFHVIITTPEDHDREAAIVQGLTHLIAKVLQRMGPMPSKMTTRSFDLLMEATSMVQNDAPEVFDAIEKMNPYSAEIRRRFFDLAHELEVELDNSSSISKNGGDGPPPSISLFPQIPTRAKEPPWNKDRK